VTIRKSAGNGGGHDYLMIPGDRFDFAKLTATAKP